MNSTLTGSRNNPSRDAQPIGIEHHAGPGDATIADRATTPQESVDLRYPEFNFPSTHSPELTTAAKIWTAKMQSFLANGRSNLGPMLAEHIGRQLTMLDNERYREWFDTVGKDAGFDPLIIRVAVATSDITKINSSKTRQLVGELPGEKRTEGEQAQPQSKLNPLQNLFLHSTAAVNYISSKFSSWSLKYGVSPSEADQFAQGCASAIVGHDSFRYGFGAAILSPKLGADYKYPASKSADGFFVQALDRLDGTTPATLMRYTIENFDRTNNIDHAIRDGIILNVAWMKETMNGLIDDAREVLNAKGPKGRKQFIEFLRSPVVDDLVSGIVALEKIAKSFTVNDDGHYTMKTKSGDVTIRSIQDFKEAFENLV